MENFLKLHENDETTFEEVKNFLKEKIKLKIQENHEALTITEKSFQMTRMNAKNYVFNYPPLVNPCSALQKLREKFNSCDQILFCGQEENICFVVKCEKQKNIRSVKKFAVGKICPTIRTFGKNHILSKMECRNLKILPYSIFSFMDSPNENICVVIAKEIENEISKIKIMFHSEYVLSTIFFNNLLEFGSENKWKDLKIFSLDSRMNEVVTNNCLKKFRCDLVVFYKNKLFVFDFKYRHGKPTSQCLLALNCLKKRNYIRKICTFIQKNYPEILNNINLTFEVGLGYSIMDEKINCQMKYNICMDEIQKIKQEEYQIV
jgi:hypothetical protein